ncbi:MAG: histidine--tRNA ligase [Acidobacteria bacterium]|nr:histidine--tRNA ligase [Acidobacteriota bacterium]
MIETVEGTFDVLPARFVKPNRVYQQIERWHLVESAAREAFRRYGIEEIRTPIIEKLELFERGVGTETDVNKEMFTFETREGSERIALRPESTASVVRAYIQNGLFNHTGLTKLYYIGAQFRHERPQKGRYRQFAQLGVEIIGQSDSPAIEAEVFEMLTWFFKELGISDTQLLLNSVGDEKCRPNFIAKLKESLKDKLPHLCGNCHRRYETNPLRVLDCKVESCQPYLNQLPRLTDMLCEECDAHFKELCAMLDERAIAYRITPRLVRGLDYYTKTAFEIVGGGKLGSQNTIVGGGRYDGLSEILGGPPTKGFGFASGIERILISLPDDSVARAKESPALFIAYLGDAARKHSFALARRLREEGVSVVVDLEGRKLKKALALADNLGANYALIIGDNEIQSQSYTLRDMQKSAQKTCSEAEIIAILKKD